MTWQKSSVGNVIFEDGKIMMKPNEVYFNTKVEPYWEITELLNVGQAKVACSGDFNNLYMDNGGLDGSFYYLMYVSYDSGNTWSTKRISNGAPDNLSSSDNNYILVTVGVTPYANVLVSADKGVSYSGRTVDGGTKFWGNTAINSNGKVMLLLSVPSGNIYTSTNYGSTFTKYNDSGTYLTRDWIACCSSSIGDILYASVLSGYTYKSTDSGSTWNATTQYTDGSYDICCSSTGQYVYINSSNGIYKSSDYGSNWNKITDTVMYNSAHSIKCSSDGSIIISIIRTNVNSSFSYISYDYGVNFKLYEWDPDIVDYDISNDGNKVIFDTFTKTYKAIRY